MHRFALTSTFFFGLALVLAGCAAGQGWVVLLTFALSFSGLVLGCGSSHGRETPAADAGPRDTGPDMGDADVDGGGVWERCCNGGVIDSCYCPAGWACNYGWFTDCGDGTCEDPGSGTMCPVDAGPPDAAPDAGGYWEPCCVDGTITTCFCPAGLACNYGWFNDCGGGTCVGPTEMCAVDGGAGG